MFPPRESQTKTGDRTDEYSLNYRCGTVPDLRRSSPELAGLSIADHEWVVWQIS